jgi:hypothetical protein
MKENESGTGAIVEAIKKQEEIIHKTTVWEKVAMENYWQEIVKILKKEAARYLRTVRKLDDSINTVKLINMGGIKKIVQIPVSERDRQRAVLLARADELYWVADYPQNQVKAKERAKEYKKELEDKLKKIKSLGSNL